MHGVFCAAIFYIYIARASRKQSQFACANATLLQIIISVGFGLPCSIRFLHMREALCYNRWQEPSKMMEPIVRTL